jgi:hypothetical protein
MLGYPELMIPLVRDALMEGRVNCLVDCDDVVSVEAGQVLWDLSLLSGGQDWSDSVLKETTTVPNRMYNDKACSAGRDVVVTGDEYGVVREDGYSVPYPVVPSAAAWTSWSRAGEDADGRV